jgi:hypothetical protein
MKALIPITLSAPKWALRVKTYLDVNERGILKEHGAIYFWRRANATQA